MNLLVHFSQERCVNADTLSASVMWYFSRLETSAEEVRNTAILLKTLRAGFSQRMTDETTSAFDVRREHWDNLYATKAPMELSWYQETPTSLALIEAIGIGPDARIIDVGGGASNLVDHLLARKFLDITVLDISEEGLAVAKARLGVDASRVNWIVADAAKWRPNGEYDLWHDRAVFHFLTEFPEQNSYMDGLRAGVPSGSHAAISTFSHDGPKRCSGLPVVRSNAERIGHALGEDFILRFEKNEDHRTPMGTVQNFAHTWFQRK
jgi:SAM-dependent methyltransferase